MKRERKEERKSSRIALSSSCFSNPTIPPLPTITDERKKRKTKKKKTRRKEGDREIEIDLTEALQIASPPPPQKKVKTDPTKCTDMYCYYLCHYNSRKLQPNQAKRKNHQMQDRKKERKKAKFIATVTTRQADVAKLLTMWRSRCVPSCIIGRL